MSSNGKRLAIANSDKVISMLDENYERRDKIQTRGLEKDNQNYVIKAIDFSPDSSVLAVVQSDNIIFCYKIGIEWGEKKSICSKITTTCTPTCIAWPNTSQFEFYFAQADGAVKVAFIKTHKSHTLYSTDSYVVSLAFDKHGKHLVSGHLDGQVYVYNVETQNYRKLINVGTVPYALAFGRHIVVSGSSNIVHFVDKNGNSVQKFDYSQNNNMRTFSGAYFNPTGDSVVVTGFSCLVVFNYNQKKSEWEENGLLTPLNYYNVTAACWKPDGSKFITANVCGSVDLLDISIKKLNFKGKFELNYLSSSKIRITSIEKGTVSTVSSQKGFEIVNVDFFKDRFVAAFTTRTLIVGDLVKNKISEVDWAGSGSEKFEFTDYDLFLVFNAGEVSLIEFGKNDVLASFRTQHTSKRLISVVSKHNDKKKYIAYLLDSLTIRVLNAINKISEFTIEHDIKVNWLQLNPNANKLLFKDVNKRLFLYCFQTREKINLLSFCGFCCWVAESDVIVAQNKSGINIWYSSDSPDKKVVLPIRGVVTEIKTKPKLCVVALEGNIENIVELDDTLMKFSFALENKSISACLAILEDEHCQHDDNLWKSLLKLSEENQNYVVMERCFVALGDIAKAQYYHLLNKCSKKLQSCDWEVQSMIAIINGEFAHAERLFFENGRHDKAIEMYQSMHKWDDSLRIAKQYQKEDYAKLRENYLDWLLNSRQFEKTAELYETDKDFGKAIDFYLQAGLPARASSLIIKFNLPSSEPQITRIVKALNDSEMFECLGEIYEFLKDFTKAIAMYIKSAVFDKAIELARRHIPEQVVLIEEKWGNHLMNQNQKENAVNHFIEARCAKQAIEAAIECHQWNKAISLLSSFSGNDLKTYCLFIAEKLVLGKQFDLAEKYFVKADKKEMAFKMYIQVKRVKDAFKFAKANFTQNELDSLCEKLAKDFELCGDLEDAERLYLEIKKPELAIKMYKSLCMYDKMLRLFSVYRPDNLKEAHNWIAKKLEEQEELAKAEKHYLQAGNWTAIIDMYEKAKLFDHCLRICKNYASDRDTVERIKRWDLVITEAELIEVIKRAGLVGSLIDYFCEKKKFDEAFKCAENYRHKLVDIHLAYAMHLEDEHHYKEAEKEYVLAGKYDQVVHMYVEIQDYIAAIQVARQYDHKLLDDIYLKQGQVALNSNDFEKMEMCFIAAKRPELAISALSKLGLMGDAIRLARKHCPALVKELNHSIENNAAVTASENIPEQVRIWEEAREWDKAIDLCLEACESNTERVDVLESLWERAIQTAYNFSPDRYLETVKIVCKRLRVMNRFNQAGEYYDSVQMYEEAIKCFLSISEIDRARQSCSKIPDPDIQFEMKQMIEKSLKEHLIKNKDAEQLIGNQELKEGFDLMIERGDWHEVLKISHSKDKSLFEHYLLKCLNEFMDCGKFTECLQILTKFEMPSNALFLASYRRLVDETFALCDSNEINDLKSILFTFLQLNSQFLSSLDEAEFQKYLLVAHFNQMKNLFDKHQLTKLSADVAVSLVRFIDLMTIDKPFYDAGQSLRTAGNEIEAFMYLNRYLDIFELIRNPQSVEIDESEEFKKCDIPSFKALSIPTQNLISETDKDAIRDWLLSVSLKKQVLALPDKSCGGCGQSIYKKAVKCPFCSHTESFCYLTGLPVSKEKSMTISCCGKKFNEESFKNYSGYFNHCPWCNKTLRPN